MTSSPEPIAQLNKAFEDGLEALRVCASDEHLSARTAAKVSRAITAMCNAMPVLDMIDASKINPADVAELRAAYEALLPGEMAT